MIRVIAFWAASMAALLLMLIVREEQISAQGRIPSGRLRRLWFRADRRRAPRYRVDWVVRYRRSESQSTAPAQTRDVSQTGAGLTVLEKLPVGSMLNLEVNLPNQPRSLALTGQVVWTKEVPASPNSPDSKRRFFVGIRFHNLTIEAQAGLLGLLGNPAADGLIEAGGESTQPDRSAQYARIKRVLWLVEVGMSAAFLWGVSATGVSQKLDHWATGQISLWPLQVALYVGLLWLGWSLFSFPLDWFGGFRLEHRFGLSTQEFREWLKDYGKQSVLGGLLGLILVEGLSTLVRTAPAAWWLWATLCWIAWSVLLTRVGPILLIPIFYRQTPLADASLQHRLEQLLERCRTRVRGIFEVNLSRTTRKANACLCGMGGSRRVLISDTLLSHHAPEEVEVVLAHELGHHRMHHIGILLALSSLSTGFSCFLVDRGVRLWSLPFGISSLQDLSALPLIGLGLLLAGLLLMPVTQGISRWLEAQADRFALEQTRNPSAFITTMRRLAEQNLSELEPPRWVEWLLYDHPPIAKRIAMAERFGATHA